MKKSELQQIIREEIQKVLNEEPGDDYSYTVAKRITYGNLDQGKSEKELYSVIYDIVFNDPNVGQGSKNRTSNVVWGDEDFVSNVLYFIDQIRKQQL